MNDVTNASPKFAIRKFAEIPKVVGRGAKPGTGRPSIYPFADLKEPGDGFTFATILTKKVRGAAQAFRQNNPKHKFAIRDLRDDNGKPTNESACILVKIMTDEEYAAYLAEREAQKQAQAAAEAQGVTTTVKGENAASAAPSQSEPVVAASVDDALAGLL